MNGSPGDLSRSASVEDLASLARRALAAYELDVAALSLITNDYNCTFRVNTADGERYVLRVNLPHRRRDEEIDAELAWLAALARETDIGVPAPVPAQDGSLVVTASAEGVPEPRRCTVFAWVPGSPLADDLSDANLSAFGEGIARLHEHGRTFGMPPGLTHWREPFSWTEPVVVFDEALAPIVSGEDRAVFERARDAAAAGIEFLEASGEPRRIAHGDLHQDNVFVEGGRVWFLDFDDCMAAWPVQDLGVTFWEICEPIERFPAVRAPIRAGYERVTPWPERRPGEIATFAANRALLRINYLVQEDDAEFQARAPEWVHQHAVDIEWLLDIGDRGP